MNNKNNITVRKRDSIKRYSQILYVFTKYGFGLLLEQLGIFKYLSIKKMPVDEKTKSICSTLSRGARFRLALEELGPTFIKLGQILSTRPDIFPSDVLKELKLLQDAAPPFPFSEVKSTIENELCDKLDKIFKEFEEIPIAAASISQVHLARMNSGKLVAVKVKRPDVEKTIELDIGILKDIADFIDNHTKYGKLYDSYGMVCEFEKVIKDELDFIKEGENAETFKSNFRKDNGIKIPDIKWIYTTKNVLTMEYIEGIRIDDISALDLAGIDKKIVAKRLATSILNQILRDGFFHADPHPGNIRVLPDGTIVFLDLGMVGYLNEALKEIIVKFFIGIANKDSTLIVRSIIELGAVTERVNKKKFEKEVEDVIDKYLTMPLNEIKAEDLLNDTFRIAFSNNIKIPRVFALLAKTLGTLQSILENLDPDLNALIIAKPIAKRLIYQTFSINKINDNLKKNLWDYMDIAKKLPSVILNLLTKAEDEDFKFQVEFKEINKVQKGFERAFNRLSFCVVLLGVSIIIAGIVVGSGLSADVGSEMYFLNITLLKIGLVAAFVIVAGLIISLIRSRK